jgi:proteic killer suppression protein
MIGSFADKNTEKLFRDARVAEFASFERQARRKLQLLNSVVALDELRAPPGNRLEALKGDLAGHYSIRINDQWRICFRWQDGPCDVRIVDYH